MRVCDTHEHVLRQVVREGTDFGQPRFGQSIFGQRGFGPANFGQIHFWPIHFWPIHFWPIHSWIWCVSWSSPNPEKIGPFRVGAPKGGAPEGGAVEAQNFALFLPSLTTNFALFLSLCVFSWFFGGVWKLRGRQMCTFEVLGLSCGAPAARSVRRRGVRWRGVRRNVVQNVRAGENRRWHSARTWRGDFTGSETVKEATSLVGTILFWPYLKTLWKKTFPEARRKDSTHDRNRLKKCLSVIFERERMTRQSSPQHINQPRKLQTHHNLDNSKLHNSTNHFSAHTSFHYLLSIPFCKVEGSHNISTDFRRGLSSESFRSRDLSFSSFVSWKAAPPRFSVPDLRGPEAWRKLPTAGYRNRHSSFTAPTPFRRAFGEDRSSSSFRPRDLTFSPFVSLEKHLPPRFSAPDLCRPSALPSCICASLAPTQEPAMFFVYLPQIFQSHRSPGFPHTLYTRIVSHTCLQTLSVTVQNFEAFGNIPFFPYDSAIIIAEPLWMPNLEPEVFEFWLWKLISIQLEFTRQDFLLFPADIFASHLTLLSTPGHPCWTRAPHVAVLLPSWRFACKHPVALSSPSWRPIRLRPLRPFFFEAPRVSRWSYLFSFLLFFVRDRNFDHFEQFGFSLRTIFAAVVPRILLFFHRDHHCVHLCGNFSPLSLRHGDVSRIVRTLTTFTSCWLLPSGLCSSVHSLPCHLSRFSVMARFGTAVVFVTLDSILPSLEEHEDGKETWCMVSESKEAVASDSCSHSSLFSSMSSSPAWCRSSRLPLINHPSISLSTLHFRCVLCCTVATDVNIHDVGVCFPPSGLEVASMIARLTTSWSFF